MTMGNNDEDPAGWIAIFALITLMTWWLMV
jgi:hypothetical protein